MDSILGEKLFGEQQANLTHMIMIELLSVGNGIDYRTKKIQPSTLEKILRDDLKLDYAIESKQETSRKSENYKKRYLIINKL